MLQGNAGLKPKEGEYTSRPWEWPINLRVNKSSFDIIIIIIMLTCGQRTDDFYFYFLIVVSILFPPVQPRIASLML